MREQMLLIDVTSQGQINNAFLCFFSLCFAWTWRKTVRLTANLNWGLLIEFAWVTVTHANSIERRQLTTQNMMAGCNDHFAAANLLPIYGVRYQKAHKKIDSLYANWNNVSLPSVKGQRKNLSLSYLVARIYADNFVTYSQSELFCVCKYKRVPFSCKRRYFFHYAQDIIWNLTLKGNRNRLFSTLDVSSSLWPHKM